MTTGGPRIVTLNDFTRGAEKYSAPADDMHVSPHDLDAERAVLGSILLTDGAALDGLTLTPGDFFRDAHEVIFDAARDLRAAGRPVDLLTLRIALVERDALERVGGPAYIAMLIDGVPRSSNAPEYARRVRELAVARRGIAALRYTAGVLHDHPEAIGNGLPVEHAATWAEITADARRDESCSIALPDLAALADAPARVPLVGPLVAEREIAMLSGQPRSRKTWIADEVAVSLAAYLAPFGIESMRPTAPRGVLIVGNEDSQVSKVQRLAALLAGHGVTTLPDRLRLIIGQGASLDDLGWQRRIRDEITRYEIALVELDPIRSLTAAADQGPSELRPFASYLRQLVVDTGVTIMLVHHDTKPQAGVTDTRRRAQRASGGGLFAIVDAPMHVESIDERRSLLAPDGFKHGEDPPSLVIELRVDGDGARLIAEPVVGKSAEDVALNGAVMDYLRSSGGGSGRAICQAIPRRRVDVLAALNRLAAAGVVDEVDDGKHRKLWCVR